MLLALEVKVLYILSMYYFIQRMFEMCLPSFLLYLMLTKGIKSGIYILQHFLRNKGFKCRAPTHITLPLRESLRTSFALVSTIISIIITFGTGQKYFLERPTIRNDFLFHPPLFLIANCGFWIFLFELCVVQKPQKDLYQHMKEDDNDDSFYVISRFSYQLQIVDFWNQKSYIIIDRQTNGG